VILALAGGVGGARLASGLALAVEPGGLTIAVNVGDDFEHLGLSISPDLDTVMYTLAGLHNRETGWGRADETWRFMESLEALGGETWFRLGDRDLAVHVERTRRLHLGETLSSITADFCERLGIRQRVLPVTDAPLRTRVRVEGGELAFQEYFVRLKCAPAVTGFRFDGAQAAAPGAALAAILESDALEGVVICPSNPWLSVAPILAIEPIRALLTSHRVPVVAVSPIVAGSAVKGPAAKIMGELGVEISASGVANHYGSLVDGWLIDRRDAALAPGLRESGFHVAIADTLMDSPEKCRQVAVEAVDLLRSVAGAL
jgi:LPPG:FO 2-phospho-L-lactate transferase